MKVVPVILLLLFPTGVLAQSSHISRSSIVAAIAAHSADTITTVIGTQHGTTEANPSLRPLANNPVALCTVKMGVGLFTVWLTSKLDHPKVSTAINWTVTGVLGSISVHNLKVLHDHTY